MFGNGINFLNKTLAGSLKLVKLGTTITIGASIGYFLLKWFNPSTASAIPENDFLQFLDDFDELDINDITLKIDSRTKKWRRRLSKIKNVVSKLKNGLGALTAGIAWLNLSPDQDDQDINAEKLEKSLNTKSEDFFELNDEDLDDFR